MAVELLDQFVFVCQLPLEDSMLSLLSLFQSMLELCLVEINVIEGAFEFVFELLLKLISDFSNLLVEGRG